jgi:hypothetical protein
MSLVKGKGNEGAGTGSAGAGNPDAGAGAGNTGGNGGADESARFRQPEARPDYVPEKFWKDGKVDLETAFKSYGELETRFNTKTEDLLKQLDTDRRKGLPEAPEKYEVKLGENAPVEKEALEAHPALAWWRKTAFDAGMPPDKFNEGVSELVGILTQGPDLEAEKKALGDNADARIGAVEKWAQSTFSDASEFEAIQLVASSAAGIRALERLMGGNAPLADTQDSRPPDITIEELRSMQNDPRYYSPARRDPAFVKRVDEGFAKIYGKKK